MAKEATMKKFKNHYGYRTEDKYGRSVLVIVPINKTVTKKLLNRIATSEIPQGYRELFGFTIFGMEIRDYSISPRD